VRDERAGSSARITFGLSKPVVLCAKSVGLDRAPVLGLSILVLFCVFLTVEELLLDVLPCVCVSS
jgi:hypothetical protein